MACKLTKEWSWDDGANIVYRNICSFEVVESPDAKG